MDLLYGLLARRAGAVEGADNSSVPMMMTTPPLGAAAALFCQLLAVGLLVDTRLGLQGQVGELAERLGAADSRAERLERQVAELRADARQGGRDDGARRRAQRTGGAEAAQIITIETTAVTCPASSGRFGLTECQDPAFERCHHAACVPILQGHRRMQAADPQSCTAQTLPARTAAVNAACCPGDGCLDGHPDTCSAACAGAFLPWWRDCEVSLGKNGRQFEPTVELCEVAGGTEVSIAQQLGVECTDGTSTADCVPECSEELHGFLLLLNIAGDDSKLSCELHHGFYSWVGAAVGANISQQHLRCCTPVCALLTDTAWSFTRAIADGRRVPR